MGSTFSVAVAVARAANQFPAASLALAFLMVSLNLVWALVAGDANDAVFHRQFFRR